MRLFSAAAWTLVALAAADYHNAARALCIGNHGPNGYTYSGPCAGFHGDAWLHRSSNSSSIRLNFRSLRGLLDDRAIDCLEYDCN